MAARSPASSLPASSLTAPPSSSRSVIDVAQKKVERKKAGNGKASEEQKQREEEAPVLLLFVVWGTMGSGKSSTINGIFAHGFCHFAPGVNSQTARPMLLVNRLRMSEFNILIVPRTAADLRVAVRRWVESTPGLTEEEQIEWTETKKTPPSLRARARSFRVLEAMFSSSELAQVFLSPGDPDQSMALIETFPHWISRVTCTTELQRSWPVIAASSGGGGGGDLTLLSASSSSSSSPATATAAADWRDKLDQEVRHWIDNFVRNIPSREERPEIGWMVHPEVEAALWRWWPWIDHVVISGPLHHELPDGFALLDTPGTQSTEVFTGDVTSGHSILSGKAIGVVACHPASRAVDNKSSSTLLQQFLRKHLDIPMVMAFTKADELKNERESFEILRKDIPIMLKSDILPKDKKWPKVSVDRLLALEMCMVSAPPPPAIPRVQVLRAMLSKIAAQKLEKDKAERERALEAQRLERAQVQKRLELETRAVAGEANAKRLVVLHDKLDQLVDEELALDTLLKRVHEMVEDATKVFLHEKAPDTEKKKSGGEEEKKDVDDDDDDSDSDSDNDDDDAITSSRTKQEREKKKATATAKTQSTTTVEQFAEETVGILAEWLGEPSPWWVPSEEGDATDVETNGDPSILAGWHASHLSHTLTQAQDECSFPHYLATGLVLRYWKLDTQWQPKLKSDLIAIVREHVSGVRV